MTPAVPFNAIKTVNHFYDIMMGEKKHKTSIIVEA